MDLFHITTRAAWEAAQQRGAYRPESLDSEGFIHLSLARQWRRVAKERFRGQRDLVLLAIPAQRLADRVRFEAADGDRFPHLYDELSSAAVARVYPLAVADDGSVATAPEELP